ncbi:MULTISPECIES: SH3 domain-containing protein [unclassified Streptomyces]|uniref:SH3 domain-containing protein n=1 Tax=unclassified Streptomyces TaxID=2593676 RepID=UPI002366725B|nr:MULTISPECIES: SH3 domain-containing protein [unclassified Streptomyces]MDF3146939.1 SH3 domain-containing protein [Streptomyces sp. T21Q-yed]WDF43542.1 SH3 domain-containing protein [Streptomyces sp. T12]
MRSTRIAISAAMLGALALPVLSTAPASAAPVAATLTPTSIGTPCPTTPLPYKVHTSAVTIRSKATTKSTAVGVLYKSHKFTVHKKSGNWLYITDRTTGVKGWVSGTYVYRDTRMCLD